MNRLLIGIILLTLSNCAFTQVLTWSEPLEVQNKTQFADILITQKGFSLIRSKEADFSQKLYIERYNDSLKLLSQIKLLPSKKEGNIISYFESNNEILIFRSIYSLIDGYNTLILDRYKNEESKAFNSIEITKSPLKDYGDKGDFLITRSEDKQQYLCYYTTADDNGNDVVNLIAIKPNAQLGYQKIFPQIFGNINSELIQIECDDSNNAYLLYTEPDIKKRRDDDELIYKLAIYNQTENKLYISILDSGANKITDLYMTLNKPTNEIILGGFYDHKKKPGIAGEVLIKTSLTDGVILHSHYNQINDSFRMKALGEKQFYTNPTIKDYVIRHQFTRSDGSSVLIAERVFTSQQNYSYMNYGTMQTSYRTVFNFNEIAIFATDAEGKMLWQQAIKKNQATINDGGIYSGFIWSVYSDRILFHFNTNGKNGASIIEYALLNNGELLQRDFLKTDEEEYLVIPSESKQISYSDVLFILTKNQKRYLLKSRFPF
ncbi:MAG: hypothetical protein HYZ42_03685 [Bacteroidetes bacterium]|nr:hypothetical protein [Bacteroidota bacterium]